MPGLIFTITFNSLSRDHRHVKTHIVAVALNLSTPSLGITRPIKHEKRAIKEFSFNSLSRDHNNRGFVNFRMGWENFQLPLSGSRASEAGEAGGEVRELSTPSLGITEPKTTPM